MPDDQSVMSAADLATLLTQRQEVLERLLQSAVKGEAFQQYILAHLQQPDQDDLTALLIQSASELGLELERETPSKPPAPSIQDALARSVISPALIAWVSKRSKDDPLDVIIDVNMKGSAQLQGTNDRLHTLINRLFKEVPLDNKKSNLLPQYVFTCLTYTQIQQLIQADNAVQDGNKPNPTIYRVWPDFDVQASIYRTGATIKAEAARASFAAAGEGVVWAVLDSGIDHTHPHFQTYETLQVAPIQHQDFTKPYPDDAQGEASAAAALTDQFGHGTHVAGIIAGAWLSKAEWTASGKDPAQWQPPNAARTVHDGDDTTFELLTGSETLSGIAPKCRLVSYKVLDPDGSGKVSNLLLALAHIRQVNGDGSLMQIHGVNISAAYAFEPEWFACGQSPLCTEVDRLVRSGVVVVVSAGNTGYGTVDSREGHSATVLAVTINDPGNAQLAITVGATHRESPHQYGVSYFSSKGPTGDGRHKPDLVAPGERILSCAAGPKKDQMQVHVPGGQYLEDSGTSMAAPHVSGAAAAFLSVQREFVGKPEDVKRILMDTATDLGRTRDFQGAGLVDVMRAIQSV